MPSRYIPTASGGLLGSVLILAGIGYAAIGYGWIVTPTQQRLSGIEWLGIAGSDVTVGAGWAAVGLISALCGALSRYRKIETAGTLLSIGWPILIGFFFLAAWIIGESRTGWITTVSYTLFAALIWRVASEPKSVTPPSRFADLEPEARSDG